MKVPKLKVKAKKLSEAKLRESIPMSSIINILIKSAVEKAKHEKKEKTAHDDRKAYTILQDNKEIALNGGYASSSKGYGAAPLSSYVNYEKIFSYLGKFRSQSAYENMGSHAEFLNKASESGSFTLVDKETMDTGARFIKYFQSKTPIDKSSLVPPAGMNSSEWEQFKLFMRLDTSTYLLKISTS